MSGVGNTFFEALIEPNSLAYLALVVIAAPLILNILKAHFNFQAKDKLKLEKVSLLKDILFMEAKPEESKLLKELAFESLYKFRFDTDEIDSLLKLNSPSSAFAFYKRFHKALRIENGEIAIREEYAFSSRYVWTKTSSFCKRTINFYFLFAASTYLTGQGAYYIRSNIELSGNGHQFLANLLSIISLASLFYTLEKLLVASKYQRLDDAYRHSVLGLKPYGLNQN